MAKYKAEQASLDAEFAQTQRTESRRTAWLLGVFGVLLGVTSFILCAGLLGLAWPASTANNRALCDDAMTRLMRAETIVDLEREKFLLGSMGCSVERRLADLRPVAARP
ncbi:hypothetical protein ACFQU2_32675 [Siccirubricoccus deserti]